MASERENGGIRQAAILMASVDSQTARQLLQQMPPATAKAIRRAMVDLGRIDANEQRAVLAAFQSRVQPQKSKPTSSVTSTGSNSSISRDDQGRQGFSPIHPVPATAVGGLSSSAAIQATTSANQFWDHYCADQIIEVVTAERPTVIAVVLAQLQPLVANQVLAKLPNDLRKEVLVQISRLQQVEGEIIEEIKEQLQRKLALTRPVPYADQELGSNRLKAILEAGDERMKMELCEAIEESNELNGTLRYWVKEQLSTLKKPMDKVSASLRNASTDTVSNTTVSSQSGTVDVIGSTNVAPIVKASFANEKESSTLAGTQAAHSKVSSDVIDVAHSYIEFEDLKWLGLNQLAHILQNCEPRALLVALSTADDDLLERVAMLFSRKDWKRLNERLQSLGPMDDEDRIAARLIVSETAQQLLIGEERGLTSNSTGPVFARAA